jgi:hypothetical protein
MTATRRASAATRRALLLTGAVLAAVVWVLAPEGPGLRDGDPVRSGETDGAPKGAAPDATASRTPVEQEAPAPGRSSRADERRAIHTSLTVEVRLPDGEPVVDHPLWFVQENESPGVFGDPVHLTDARGLARLEPVTPGPVHVEGRPDLSGTVTVAQGEAAHLLLTLDPTVGTTVRGRVVTRSGGPLAAAQVWCSRIPGASDEGSLVAVTDDAGGFEVQHLTDGHLLAARADGHLPGQRHPVSHLRDQFGDVVELVLEPGGFALDVLVRDDEGAPLEGVSVKAEHAAFRVYGDSSLLEESTERHTEPVLTDAQGLVRLENLPRDVTVSARLPGHTIAEGYILFTSDGTPRTLGQCTTVDLPGNPDVLEVTLHAEARLMGRVTDEQGRPVVGALVSHLFMTGQPVGQRRTDEDGQYLLRGLSGWALDQDNMVVSHQGYQTLTANVSLESGRATSWDPVLVRGGTLTGRVLDPDGRPVPGVRLRIEAEESSRADLVVEPDGHFVVGGLPAGPVALEVFEDEDAGSSWPSLERLLTVPAEGVELVLPPGLVSGVVTATVLDPDGTPLAADVRLKRDGDREPPSPSAQVRDRSDRTERRGATDPSTGALRLDRVRAGPHELRIQVQGRPNLTHVFDYPDVSAPLDLGTLHLAKGAQVQVTPRFVGSPIEDDLISVSIIRPDGRFVTTQVVKVGQARTFIVPAGDYDLAVTDDETASYALPLSLEDGDREAFTLDVEPALTVNVQADKPAQAFAPLLDIRIRELGGDVVRRMRWSGRNRLRKAVGLRPGNYEVQLGEGGRWEPFQASQHQQILRLQP